MSSLDAQKLTRKSHKKCKSTTSLGRTRHTIRHHLHWFFSSISKLWGGMALIYSYYIAIYGTTWWLIPLSKWVITPVINGIFVGLIHWNHWGELTHLRAVGSSPPSIWHYIWPRQNSSNIRVQSSEVFFEVNFVGFFNAQQREALGTCHCCQQISGGTLPPPPRWRNHLDVWVEVALMLFSLDAVLIWEKWDWRSQFFCVWEFSHRHPLSSENHVLGQNPTRSLWDFWHLDHQLRLDLWPPHTCDGHRWPK